MHPDPTRRPHAPADAPAEPPLAAPDRAALVEIVGSLPVAVALIDVPDHRVLLANAPFHAIARGKGELVGKTVEELAPEEAARLVPMVEGVVATGQPLHVEELELLLERGAGLEHAWFRFSLHPHGRAVLAVAEEITGQVLARRRLEDELERHASLRELVASLRWSESRERARAEELKAALEEKERLRSELERQAASLESVLAAVADGLVVTDARANIVRMNEAAGAFHPYDAAESKLPHAERLALGRFRKPDGTPLGQPETPIGRALRGERTLNQVMQLVQAGRPRRWLSSSAAPIRGAGGEITGVVATSSDVTALVELRERVEDLNRALTHDLRTPLAAALLQAQALRRHPESTVNTRAAGIETGLRRMAAMIESLVDLAGVESGRLSLALRPVELGPVVRGLLERFAGVLAVERVTVELPDDLPPLLADVDRLERILVNLLANALKYSPADRPVRLSASPVEGGVAFAVEDRGPGIAAADLPRIFDRFFRAGRSDAPGLGLGLYITRQLVEAHGGTIDAESEVGVGSRFRVTLPTLR